MEQSSILSSRDSTVSAPAAVSALSKNENKRCDTFEICNLFDSVVNKIAIRQYVTDEFVLNQFESTMGKQKQKAAAAGPAQQRQTDKRFEPQQWRSTSDLMRWSAQITIPHKNQKIKIISFKHGLKGRTGNLNKQENFNNKKNKFNRLFH